MAIKLGGGGGGGAEIGDVKYIANTDNLITTDSGEKWQKSGVASNTDTTTYPDAPVFYGPISSTADTEVTRVGGSGLWYSTNAYNSSCTNGEWIWTGRGDANKRIYAWHLSPTASATGYYTAYNGGYSQFVYGGMLIHAHSDGKIYTVYTNYVGGSYHQCTLQRYAISNSSSPDLTLENTTTFNDYTRTSTGGAWVRADGYEDRMWIIATSGTTVYVNLIDLDGNVYTSENFVLGGTVLQTKPYEVKSAHVFNGKYILVGDRGDAYVYTLNWQFVEKITTGVPNDYYFFSKTDTTATDLSKDNYGSIAESASGVNNYQRMYEITSTGYKNHPASTHIGSEDERLDGAGVSQYVRIL